MATVDEVLAVDRPAGVEDVKAHWPSRDHYTPSPVDWRDECLYFLLPDRFSDENARPLLDRRQLAQGRGGSPTWTDATWDAWAQSGRTRFQGGTLKGIVSRLDYLKELGVTALWIGPVWKQRRESFVNDLAQPADEYHGYAIQDFLDVDPRFGTRQDLVDVVTQAHARDIRVIFDIVINHTGRNWLYAVDGTTRPLTDDPDYTGRRYDFGAWLDGNGTTMVSGAAPGADDAVWPRELQNPDVYHRMGNVVSWDGSLLDDNAQFRTGDMTNRDLDLGGPQGATLQLMITCWTYWLSLTDCDGFRIDTLKHTAVEEARTFCSAVREFAETLGKQNFLLAGEVAEGNALTVATAPPQFQGDNWAQAYLDLLGQSLTATLEIGDGRTAMRRAAALNDGSAQFLNRYNPPERDPLPASHRTAGACFITVVDDHDGLGGNLQRFPMLTNIQPSLADEQSADSFFHPLQSVTAAAFLLFTLGIPCLFYGLEQGMSGAARKPPWNVPQWQDPVHGGDRYLREAMFGPEHPRRLGAAGRPAVPGGPTEDSATVGFGPFGTTGLHLFDQEGLVYRRIRSLLSARAAYAPLRAGRQYCRPATRTGEDPAGSAAAAGIVAWSRILGQQEAVVVVNTNPPPTGGQASGAVTAQVLVDLNLNPPGMARFRVAASTAQCDGLALRLNAGTLLDVQSKGAAYVVVPDLPPHEVVVLVQEHA